MNKNKGIFLILSTAFISGISVFINQFGVNVINPYIFTGLKNIIVALFVIGCILMLKDWKILKNLDKTQWSLLVIVGFIGGFIPFILFFKGLSLTNGIQAAFIHKTMFIFIFILAAIFLKEKISKNLLICSLFLFLGNILLLKLTSIQFNLGDLLVFLAVLFWAGENVLSKYLLKELPSRIIICGRMFFGSIFIVMFWFVTNQAHLALSLNAEQIGWVAITSILLLGYIFTWYTGLKYINVSDASVILLLASPVTIFLCLFGGQVLVLRQIFGMILICGTLIYLCCQNLIVEEF
ncbi:DMT family transporter [Patescibacteria group bacterium]